MASERSRRCYGAFQPDRRGWGSSSGSACSERPPQSRQSSILPVCRGEMRRARFVPFAQERRVELGVAQSRIPLFSKPTNPASLRNGALHSVPSQRPTGEREGARFVSCRVLTLHVAQQTHGAEDRKRAGALARGRHFLDRRLVGSKPAWRHFSTATSFACLTRATETAQPRIARPEVLL
jgi:hypothetical protein